MLGSDRFRRLRRDASLKQTTIFRRHWQLTNHSTVKVQGRTTCEPRSLHPNYTRMAQSKYPTVNWQGSEFVESCGAVLFHLSSERICLLHLKGTEYWGLPKGRRNCTEPRHVAAVREVTEETGFPCQLLEVLVVTRAPPLVEENADTPDAPRAYHGSTEPFMMSTRVLGHKNMKLIWWFVAAIKEGEDDKLSEPEEKYERVMLGYDEAVNRLTFEADREVARTAMQILAASKGEKAKPTESDRRDST